jgi:hypothetical protein
MQTLIALRPMTYGTRRMRVGESFSAQDSHARLLVAIGRARPVDRPPPQCELAEESAAIAAEAPQDTPRRKRTYKRRDLRAEG